MRIVLVCHLQVVLITNFSFVSSRELRDIQITIFSTRFLWRFYFQHYSVCELFGQTKVCFSALVWNLSMWQIYSLFRQNLCWFRKWRRW